MVERDAAEAEIRHTSMNTKVMEEENRRSNEVESVMTQTDTSGAEVTDGVNAVPKGEEEQHVGKGALVQVVTPLRDDRRKASKVETNEKPEV